MSNNFQQVTLIEIDQNGDQQRVDNFLIRQLKGVPKSKIYKILRKGEVRVNKKRVKPEYKLQLGDIVRLPPVIVPDKAAAATASSRLLTLIETSVIYEDERYIVVNKPSGLAVHGGSGVNLGVIEVLRQSRPTSPFLELVHRIDRDTSGCLMIAKKRSALRAMHEQLRAKTVRKVYHAIVHGDWPKSSTVCVAPLHKNVLQGGERMVRVDEQQGKPCRTDFSLLASCCEYSLIEARPITGRTHQIRVHCAHNGHPIANDDKYGDAALDKVIRSNGCQRLCLHAKSITFEHPVSQKQITVEAEYDKDFQQIVSLCK